MRGAAIVRQFFVIAVVLLACGSAYGQVYRFEAETGTLGGTTISTAVAGYSGTGYVTGFDSAGGTDSVQLQASVPSSGLYELWLRYNSPYGMKGYNVSVGSESGSGSFNGTPSNQFSLDRAGVFDLSAGNNTLKVTQGWGYYNLDYFELRPFTVPPLAPVAPSLIDSQASSNTHTLMNYLTSMYGSKTIAGQQGNVGSNEVFPSASYLTKSGGLIPAARGSDFIEYSPSRLQYGSNPNGETERLISWAKQTGGIVNMMWHWNAPSGLINQPGKEWWRGFYTDSTTFDVQAALANPNGSDYQLLIRDIDAIGTQLKKFQDNNIPVLWRPLHEAQGGWFWWGAKGPQAFKNLWSLMYNRLTNVDGLHNLIWVYTSSSADDGFRDWYPGDNMVDVIGEDVYTDASSSMSGQWYDLRDEYNGKKMITLSETGTLPNANLMRQRGIDWSWASPWSVTDTVNNYSAAQLQSFLGDSDVVTLNELPFLPWKTVLGDLNRDGHVDSADLSSMLSMLADPSGFDSPKGLTDAQLMSLADMNQDGVLTGADLQKLLIYLKTGHGSEGVPEPATAVLMLIAAVWLFIKHRTTAATSM